MMRRLLPVALLAVAVGACSAMQNSVGRLTVKDYTSKSGQRVMAGQAEPRTEYNCRTLVQERQDWGLKGNMDKAASIERVTAVAVDSAPGKGANYAHVIVPSQTSVMGFNVNAFKDAQVGYYKCASLPPVALK